VRAQVEGNILQTLSRTLHEETTFDRSRVTSVDWARYPLLRFPEVPRWTSSWCSGWTSHRWAPARPRRHRSRGAGQCGVRCDGRSAALGASSRGAGEGAVRLTSRTSRPTRMPDKPTSYLLAGQTSELERLQLQSRVWEPAGKALLAELPGGTGSRVLEAGCGVMGWLRLLSEWVGPTGEVVGTDVDAQMLGRAQELVRSERLANVRLVEDNLFDSKLAPGSFDLVHARFQIAPLAAPMRRCAATATCCGQAAPWCWRIPTWRRGASTRMRPPCTISSR
jgi:hypothetical protein